MRLLAIIMLSGLFTSEPTGINPQLEDFVLASQELPNGCTLKPVGDSENLPCKAEGNPFVSSDRTFLDCFAASLIMNPSLVKNTQKGLFSIYEDQAEIGLFGLEMDTEKNAELVFEGMTAKIPNDNSIKLFQAGKVVLFMWKDQGQNDSFDEMQQMIEARIE